VQERNWLIIYGYWNAGDQIMLLPHSGRWQKGTSLRYDIPLPVETPMGLLHPDYLGSWELGVESREKIAPVLNLHLITLNLLSNIWNGISRLVQKPREQWWDLLYRKHVITKQPYIPQLILLL